MCFNWRRVLVVRTCVCLLFVFLMVPMVALPLVGAVNAVDLLWYIRWVNVSVLLLDSMIWFLEFLCTFVIA